MDRDEILRVLRAFEASGLEYVLIGATAMGFHGVVRATEDLDLFIRATAENVDRLRAPHRKVFSAWLARIADYRAMHAVTRLRAQKRGGGAQVKAFQPAAESSQVFLNLFDAAADRCETPSRPLQRKEAILAVQVSLATLPSVQREAVMHRHLDGKSVPETASAMGRTAAAVRGLLHRAKKLARPPSCAIPISSACMPSGGTRESCISSAITWPVARWPSGSLTSV